MKKLLVVCAAAIGCALFAAPQGPGGREGGPRAGGELGPEANAVIHAAQNAKLAADCGITAEQSAKLKELNKAYNAKCQELRKAMVEATKKQAAALQAEPVDEAAVMGAIHESFVIREDLAKQQALRLIEVKKILSADQIKTLLTKSRELRQSRRRGPEAGKKRPPRPGKGGEPTPDGVEPPPAPAAEPPATPAA